MKRLILILLLLMAIPCLAADWRVTVAVKKTPADNTEAKLKAHYAKKDSIQADISMILRSVGVRGWAIIDNKHGTKYVATVPDTLLSMKRIRYTLKTFYNQRVSVKKKKIKKGK